MKSMTGYGKAEYKDDLISITVEIKTVNNRFLDLNSKYPRSFIALDDVIRRAVQSKIKRGKADLFLTYENLQQQEASLEVNIPLAKSYVEANKVLSQEFSDIKNDFTITSLMKSQDVISHSQSEIDVETLSPIVNNVVISALDNLNVMRAFEGEKLKGDVLSRVSKIEELVLNIEKRAPEVQKDYSKRLYERVSEVLSSTQIDEARLIQEVAVFADKSNIDEELTRLKSHISQFRKICNEENEVGKRLDFLIQEFNREANTVCSKSNDITITDNALALKCEIEKIREQIQNIE